MKLHLFFALDKAGKDNHKRSPRVLYKPEIKDSLIRESSLPEHPRRGAEDIRGFSSPLSDSGRRQWDADSLISCKKGVSSLLPAGKCLACALGGGQCAREA